jgi:predicted RNase H-like HicB family nuclease
MARSISGGGATCLPVGRGKPLYLIDPLFAKLPLKPVLILTMLWENSIMTNIMRAESLKKKNGFTFTAVVMKEQGVYTALCLDLDVASDGRSIQESKRNLLEAVTLYLETAFESNLPYLRPVPSSEDPRKTHPKQIVEEFNH